MKDFIIVYNDELYHKGILGMKWGKRNGPPYPLSGDAHSASEKKAGKKGWTKEARKEKLKKAGRIAGAVAGTSGAVAIGGMAINKKVKDKRTSKNDHKRVFDSEKGKIVNLEKTNDSNDTDNKKTFGSKDDIKNVNRVVSGTVTPTAKALREASKETRSTGLKPASEMSNKELKDFLTRKNLEERYEKYTKETVTSRPSLAVAANVLETIGGLAVTGLSAYALYKGIKQ